MMSNKISRTDVADEEFVDAIELASDGYTNSYRTVGIVSTTAATRNVVISTPTILDRLDNIDEPVQIGDIFEIVSGTAAGIYTIESIVNPSDTFRVVEYIPDSIDGYGNLYHPAGATKIGVDTREFFNSSSNNAQDVLKDLDSAITDGYGTIQASGIGQLLFSIDGTTFQPSLPITTQNGGWLVNNLGYLQVIVFEGYGYQLPEATEIGQVLYSVDGTKFSPALPVTSSAGWLVNNDGLLIVITD